MAVKVLTDSGLDHLVTKLDTKFDTKVDKVSGKGLSANDYTDVEKAKLADIDAKAQVNVLEGVKVNGSPLTVTDKAVNIDLSAYALKSEMTTVMHYVGTVASESALPTSNNTVGDVYNVEDSGANYAWNGSSWDQLGGAVNLTGYYTKTEVDSALAGKSDSNHTHSVATDSVAGFMSSTDKKKLDSIQDGANKTIVDTGITADGTNPVQGKAIYNELAKKLNSADLVAITTAEIDQMMA